MASSAALGVTLYTEPFTYSGSGDLTAYGWTNRAYENASGNFYNQNEWQPVGVAAGSYIYGGGGGGRNDYLTWTDEYVIDRSQYTDLQMSWTNSANDPTPITSLQDYRAAVRVGGQWYATTAAQQGQTATLTFDIDDNMSLLTEVPGIVGTPSLRGFVLGAAAALPAGNIDAFGILLPDQKGDVRYYTPSISGSAVPEPASLAGGALVVSLLASRRRRA